MKELTGDLFRPNSYRPIIGVPNAICITTNGFVKKDGRAVMGRGCAKTALDLWPEIDLDLGYLITMSGNRPHILRHNEKKDTYVVSFPVKKTKALIKTRTEILEQVVRHMQTRFTPPCEVPGWALKATEDTILQSAEELRNLADQRGWTKIVLPRPGCGAGERDWETVRLLLSAYLDDRFYCISW